MFGAHPVLVSPPASDEDTAVPFNASKLPALPSICESLDARKRCTPTREASETIVPQSKRLRREPEDRSHGFCVPSNLVSVADWQLRGHANGHDSAIDSAIVDAAAALFNMRSSSEAPEYMTLITEKEKTITEDNQKTITEIELHPKGIRLGLPEDSEELNTLHCFVRSELLEIFRAGDEEAMPDKQERFGTKARIGLRCVFCGRLPKRSKVGTTMSSFFPKSLNDIYRSVCTWQRVHFRTCRHIPEDTRQMYWKLKESDKSRGKTKYWVSSARRLGLEDIDLKRGGIWLNDSKEE